jgi:tetratricopeptide (TPR) repeat protein
MLIVMLLVCGLARTGFGRPVPTETSRKNSSPGSFLQVLHFPPEDPHTGTLYREAAALLAAARELPAAVVLYPAPAPEEREEKLTRKQGWMRLSDSPVVALSRLAQLYHRTGRYERAAECYGKLAKGDPECRHYRVMWVLCRRMADRADRKVSYTEFTGAEEHIPADWRRWMKEVERISMTLKEGGQ